MPENSEDFIEKTSKNKVITCIFSKDVKIPQEDEAYKKYCSPLDEPKPEKNRTILKKFYNKSLFRISLKYKLSKKGKNATVILMNPSYADCNGLDDTLNNVRKFLEEINQKNNEKSPYSSFEILNIFPIRMAQSNNLLQLLEKYDIGKNFREKNSEYIKNVLNKNCGDIIAAWGGKYNNTEQAQEIYELLRKKDNIYAYCLNKDGSPRHFASRIFNKTDN